MSTPHGKTGALDTAESQFFRLRNAQRVGRFTHQIPLAITGINCSLAGPVPLRLLGAYGSRHQLLHQSLQLRSGGHSGDHFVVPDPGPTQRFFLHRVSRRRRVSVMAAPLIFDRGNGLAITIDQQHRGGR